MPSSFDDESNPSSSLIANKASLLTGSYSQSSIAELSSRGGGDTADSEVVSQNQNAKYHYIRLKHGAVDDGGCGGSSSRKLFQNSTKQLIQSSKKSNKYRRENSTSSDELNLWDEKQREDIVGNIIANMLNDGHVPYFGYTSSPTRDDDDNEEEDFFQLSPLFSSRNYRAIRNYFLAILLSRRDTSGASEQRQIIRSRNRHSMRFILETLAAVYIAIVSINDVILRSLSEFVLLTMVGTVISILLDVDELKQTSRALRQAILPAFITDLLKRIGILLRKLLGCIESALLWGYHFQGRTLLWSDEERLVKFRREHKRILSTSNERRQRRKATRRMKMERRKKIKRGDAFTLLEAEELETEIRAKEKLDAEFEEITMKPPTYLPEKVMDRIGAEFSRRSYATSCHLESIQYCQQMILLERERNEHKPTDNGKRDRSSPICSKDAIEVVDELPGAKPTISFEQYQRQLSQFSDEDDLFPFSDIFSTSDDGLSSKHSDSDDDDDNDDDAMTEGSYTSDSSHRSMPWMLVGAKIGHKLLNARKLRRLTLANPDAAQLIPDEAKKLIDGIGKDRSQESYPSPSKSKSQDDSDSIDVSNREIPISISPTKSNEYLEIKRPVHRMWTSAGSAAMSLNTFGAVTLAVSPTDDQSVSSFKDSSHEGLHSNENTLSRRSNRNGICAPPPSPEIEISANQCSLPKRASLPLIRHMPSLLQSSTPVTHQDLNVSDSPPRVPVTRLAPLEKGKCK